MPINKNFVFIALLCICYLPRLAIAELDPTAPLGYSNKITKKRPNKPKQTRKKTITLSAILCIQEKSCFALINGRKLYVGKRINQYVVTQIHENEVVLHDGAGYLNLSVFNQQIVQ